jgi:hypothetical protein
LKKNKSCMRALMIAAAIVLFAGAAEARFTRIEIMKSEPAFGGASFGEAGAYVRLVGRVTGEVDPAEAFLNAAT